MYYTELVILEFALFKAKQTSTLAFNPDFQRYELVERTLKSIKGWFDMHLSIPTYAIVGMHFAYWCHLGHSIASLYRLTIFHDPAWDRRAIVEKIEPMAVMDQIIRGLDEVAAKRKSPFSTSQEDDVFTKCSKMIRNIKTGWSAELSKLAEGQNMSKPPNPPAGHFTDGMMDDPSLGLPTLPYDEPEKWLADLFNVANWEI
jgi:hypothetical protein